MPPAESTHDPLHDRRFPRTQESMHSLHQCAAVHGEGNVLSLLLEHADGWWLSTALADSNTTTMDLGPFWLRDHANGRLWCAIGTWVQWRGETRTIWLYPTPDRTGWRVRTNPSDAVDFELQVRMATAAQVRTKSPTAPAPVAG